ncbi:MAG: SPOR domain-containing protein [Deltaproteobacteria bacterium]|nr:SPOR domain-containing protein [Deltaproteobacteria bacterium]
MAEPGRDPREGVVVPEGWRARRAGRRSRRFLIELPRISILGSLAIGSALIVGAFVLGHRLGRDAAPPPRGPDSLAEPNLITAAMDGGPPAIEDASPAALEDAASSSVAPDSGPASDASATAEETPALARDDRRDVSQADVGARARDAGDAAVYSLQLRAFPTEEEARAFVASSSVAVGALPVALVRSEVEGKGTWFRVRVGTFSSARAAEAARAALGDLAREAIVVSNR